ncbi:MAG: hypothetical protein LBH11_07480 [Propionibacteriaceae bacterium]|nr:hypothetical protein [Propionibacteriaceae bacterium]
MRRLLCLVTGVLLLAVSGCATDDGGPGTPTGSQSTGAPSHDPAASLTALPNVPSVLDENGRIPVNGYAILGNMFGTAEEKVLDALRPILGEPTDRIASHGCAYPVDSRYQVVAVWDGLMLTFQADDSGAASPRSLTAWSVSLRDEIAPGVSIGGVPAISGTFAEMERRHPGGTITPGPWLDSHIYVTPDGVSFLGQDESEFAYAGPLPFCD